MQMARNHKPGMIICTGVYRCAVVAKVKGPPEFPFSVRMMHILLVKTVCSLCYFVPALVVLTPESKSLCTIISMSWLLQSFRAVAKHNRCTMLVSFHSLCAWEQRAYLIPKGGNKNLEYGMNPDTWARSCASWRDQTYRAKYFGLKG